MGIFRTENYHVYGGHRGPSHVNVTEKRAPTDESIKILKEMEEAARNKVIETVVVADTSFECKIHKVHDIYSLQYIYHVIYKMNGIQRCIDIRIDQRDELTSVQSAICIRDRVALDIANEMISSAFVKATS